MEVFICKTLLLKNKKMMKSWLKILVQIKNQKF